MDEFKQLKETLNRGSSVAQPGRNSIPQPLQALAPVHVDQQVATLEQIKEGEHVQENHKTQWNTESRVPLTFVGSCEN